MLARGPAVRACRPRRGTLARARRSAACARGKAPFLDPSQESGAVGRGPRDSTRRQATWLPRPCAVTVTVSPRTPTGFPCSPGLQASWTPDIGVARMFERYSVSTRLSIGLRGFASPVERAGAAKVLNADSADGGRSRRAAGTAVRNGKPSSRGPSSLARAPGRAEGRQAPRHAAEDGPYEAPGCARFRSQAPFAAFAQVAITFRAIARHLGDTRGLHESPSQAAPGRLAAPCQEKQLLRTWMTRKATSAKKTTFVTSQKL